MQPSTKMQKVIAQLAEKYEVDLAVTGICMQLTLTAYDPLVIHQISPLKISIAHYFLSGENRIPEPMVELFTGSESGWIPISITHSLGGSRTYAHMEKNHQLVVLDLSGQAELAAFTDIWAQNIIDQQWLTRAVLDETPDSQASAPLFSMGQIVITSGAEQALETAEIPPKDLLSKHVRGEWGDLGDDDKQENNRALEKGYRLMSAYRIGNEVRVWVITEWDRSATTILLPSEY